ncbi:MAG: hypothetical protein IT328_04385 [Caldilineaceae bacterium]|nr:hypothetical protein [Caldilineaceae bacterium]
MYEIFSDVELEVALQEEFEADAQVVVQSDAIARRQVGKREWKNDLQEVLDSEDDDLPTLRTLRRRVTDGESIRLISELFERKTVRVMTLNKLYRYGEKG